MSTTATFSATVSIPANLASKAATAAAEASAAYIELWRISDSAFANPNNEWATQIRAAAVDPIASSILDSIQTELSDGSRTVGHSVVTARVVSATGVLVKISGCVDSTGVDSVDANGHSVKAANGPGNYWRYIQDATVSLHGTKWFVQEAKAHRDQQC